VETIMETAGLQLDTSTKAALAASLSAVVAAAPDTARLVRALATRAMSEAQYFSTGEVYCMQLLAVASCAAGTRRQMLLAAP
jgi:hypothetical protein